MAGTSPAMTYNFQIGLDAFLAPHHSRNIERPILVARIDLKNYPSVVIWCKRFSVLTFTAVRY
jgi:Electron transfer DM13